MNYLIIYIAVILLVMLFYVRRQRRIHVTHSAELQQAVQSGLAEPPSLHPIVDPSRCIGSGACSKVCPEQAIGVVNGKMVLKNAAACIGHGA